MPHGVVPHRVALDGVVVDHGLVRAAGLGADGVRIPHVGMRRVGPYRAAAGALLPGSTAVTVAGLFVLPCLPVLPGGPVLVHRLVLLVLPSRPVLVGLEVLICLQSLSVLAFLAVAPVATGVCGRAEISGRGLAVLVGPASRGLLGGLRDRIHRDGELDVPAELLGERLGDKGPQPRLELFLDEFVRCRDERGVLHQPERAGELQPGALVRLDLEVSEPVKRSCPDLS